MALDMVGNNLFKEQMTEVGYNFTHGCNQRAFLTYLPLGKENDI